MKEIQWQLKKGLDRRFRSGHPWVFSNELQAVTKNIELGGAISLVDASGAFMARGFGNPNSLIAFRALSRDEQEKDPCSVDGLVLRVKNAQKLRATLGLQGASYRLCYAEADQLPGLIVDYYVISAPQNQSQPSHQLFCLQLQTAGMERLREKILSALERLVREDLFLFNWDKTLVLFRNNLSIRELEGLKREDTILHKTAAGLDPESCMLWTQSVTDHSPIPFKLSFMEAQKTGFFLDQRDNLRNMGSAVLPWSKQFSGETIEILDLCSYIGQWGVQLGVLLQKQGLKVHVTAVDASEKALAFAASNLNRQNIPHKLLRADVLKDLRQLPRQGYAIVICDPPAFIKKKKDLPTGSYAYLQLNTQALDLCAKGALFFSFSCSQLFDEESFLATLTKAQRRTRRRVQWIYRGSQSPDHPVLSEFPEGRYLKAMLGVVE